MSFVLLLLSTNTSYGAHYCGGEIVKQTFLLGKQDLSCQSMAEIKTCDKKNHNRPIIKRKACCENKYLSVESEQDYQNTFRILLPTLDINLLYTNYRYEFLSLLNVRKSGYNFYRPPPKSIFKFV